MTEKKNYTTISIPTHLYEDIKKKIEGTGFESASDYVVYTLRDVLADLEKEKKIPFSKEEEEKVKERLKALGYLD